MGEKLEKVILNYAPEYWETGVSNKVILNKMSREYRDIAKQIAESSSYGFNSPQIKSIKRVQNVHDLGQFLVREQHLLHLSPNQSYYRVSTKNSDNYHFIMSIQIK